MTPNILKKTWCLTLLLGSYGLTLFAAEVDTNTSPDENCSLQECKTSEGIVIRTIGKGETDLRDTKNTKAAHAKNRRVDIDATLNQVQTVEPVDPASAEVSGRFVVYLENGGVLWATEDPVALNPLLGFSGPSRAKFENGKLLDTINFRYFSNYTAFINKLELVFYRENDIDLVSPILVTELPLAAVDTYEFAGQFDAKWNLKQGDEVQYLVRAYGANNSMDETHPKRMQLLSEAKFNNHSSRTDRQLSGEVQERVNNNELDAIVEDQQQMGQLLGQSNLRLQNIALRGSRIRILGQDMPYGAQLEINGENYPIDNESKFAAEYLLPTGAHPFDIKLLEKGVAVSEHQLIVDVTGKYMFVVAMADMTASNNSITGHMEALSANELYRDDFQVDGRLAFYLKGKIRGKYLITAQADTQERELKDLFDNFLDKDPQDIFRRLDPDQYYLVYGDDSHTYRDVDTQGRLYIRVDWDKSQALWGNYNAGITASEHNQYNRSLYGAALNWRSLQTTDTGEAKTRVKTFLSEAQTAYGHNEFIGTGGSLYYLRDTDILPGSDKLTIEIRDRDSSRVIDSVELVRDVDYEIDEFQGRIILARPMQQLSRTYITSIIRDQAYDGNKHMLLVDYEYRPDGFDADHLTLGGRAKHWMGDHLGVGVTYVDENRAGDDYQLKGADITLQAGKGTYLRLEQMESNAAQAPIFYSDNGGLSFGSNNAQTNLGDFNNVGTLRDGIARSYEARANFQELGWTRSLVTAAAWSRDTDAGFSVARRDLGIETTETGAEVSAEFLNNWKLYASTNETEQLGINHLQQHTVQLAYDLARVSVIAEIRQVYEQRGNNPEIDGTLAALEFRKLFGEKLELSATGQFTLANDNGSYDNNDRGTLKARYLFAERSELGAEYTVGHRGESGALIWDYFLNSKHNLYGRYSFSTDESINDFSQQSDGLTLGHRSRITDKLSIYNENQNLKTLDGNGFNHTFGLDYRVSQFWNLGLSVQHGKLDGDTGFVDRDVVSTSASYRNQRTNFSSKVEYREDDGSKDLTQWVSTSRWTYLINDDWKLAARFNYADTEDDHDIDPATGLVANADAKFIEGGVGFAYRPTMDNKWSVLGRYTYLYDLRALSQRSSGTDQKSNIFAIEAIRRLSARWDLVGKYAHRETEVRLDRQDDIWFDSSADLAAFQVLYHLVSDWDALVEYRVLSVNGDSDRSGFLLEVDKHIGDHFKVGAGYNFTDFSDDLSKLDYEYKGWFINMVGKY